MIKSLMGAGLMLAMFGLGGASAQSLGEELAAADVKKGANVFKKCRACHTVDEGGPNKVGPNLWGVINRPVASVDRYKYSAGMRELDGVWTLERLDEYLTKPRSLVPKGSMAFVGLPKLVDRANVIAYLNENSPEPISFEAAGGGGAAAAGAEPIDREEAEYGNLFVAPGVEETFIYCTPCHSEMIIAQQGKTRKHWDDLFGWMIDEQGMAEIDEPERSIILDYLETHYNVDRPNFSRN